MASIISAGTTSGTSLNLSGDTSGVLQLASNGSTTAVTIDTSQNVGIGTSSPLGKLEVRGSGNTAIYLHTGNNSGDNSLIYFGDTGSATVGLLAYDHGTNAMTFHTNSAERMRITSAGNVGIGTTSPSATLDVGSSVARSGAAQNNIYADYRITAATTGVVSSLASRIVGIGGSTYTIPDVAVYKADPTVAQTGVTITNAYGLYIGNMADPTSGGSVTNSWGVYQTSSSNQNYFAGNVLVGQTTRSTATVGFSIISSGGDAGQTNITTSSTEVMNINRNTSDGELIRFRQDNNVEGNISVSGSTVSYNGGHLSRWSQLPDGSKDDTILKGTVLTNLDDMCVWEKDGVVADNEQLNKMKVSDVEGDTNVAGVFVNWTIDEQYGVDDMNVAMTGDMIIRIAEGVVVQKGDLLMSAGDGTAKPQGDDIVRSKTVAKVTSNHVTCTYADGSYCVPCVLMAC